MRSSADGGSAPLGVAGYDPEWRRVLSREFQAAEELTTLRASFHSTSEQTVSKLPVSGRPIWKYPDGESSSDKSLFLRSEHCDCSLEGLETTKGDLRSGFK
jgi:hypothetical protein